MKTWKSCRRDVINRVGAAVAAVWLIGSLPGGGMADPSNYKFTRLATLGEPNPGTEQFSDFQPQAIDLAGNVAFVADLKQPGGDDIGEGVFASRSGQLLQIMEPGQLAPGSPGESTFLSLPEAGVLGLTLSDSGDGAFAALLTPFDDSEPIGINAGLYRFSLDVPEPSAVVVPDATSAPTGGNFAGVFYSSSLDRDGDLVFAGVAPGLQLSEGPGFNGLGIGLFEANPENQIAKVVVPGDAAPGGKVFDDAWRGWLNNIGTIGFQAHTSGDECIDIGNSFVCGSSVYERSASGQIESIAHQGDPTPCGGTYRLAFGPIVNDADHLVFIGDLTPASEPPFQALGVFVNSNGNTTAVACPGAAMPGGGQFVTASRYAYTARLNNLGETAFVARLDTDTNGSGVGDTGLYVLSHSQLQLVARTGTSIPGVGTIAQINDPFYGNLNGSFIADEPAINDGGQIFFEAMLMDGTTVLLVASPEAPQ